MYPSGVYGQQGLPTAAPSTGQPQTQLFPPLQPHSRTPSALSTNMLATPNHSRGPSLLQPGSPSRNSFLLDAAPAASRTASAASSPLKVAVLPSTRDRVIAFYKRYNPSKLANIEDILKSYKGREVELMQALAAKYGPEDKWWLQAAKQQDASHAVGVQQMASRQGGSNVKQQQQQQALQQGLTSPMRSGGPAGGPASMQARPGTPTLATTAQQGQMLQQQQVGFQQRLFAILKRHDPAKLHLIPQMLSTFRGNEENLIVGLERKYAMLQSQTGVQNTGTPTVAEQQQRSTTAQASAVASVVNPGPQQQPSGGVPSRDQKDQQPPPPHAHHAPLRPLNPKLAELVVSDSEEDSDTDQATTVNDASRGIAPPKDETHATGRAPEPSDTHQRNASGEGAGETKPAARHDASADAHKASTRNVAAHPEEASSEMPKSSATETGPRQQQGGDGNVSAQRSSMSGAQATDAAVRSSRPNTPREQMDRADTTRRANKPSSEANAAPAAAAAAAAAASHADAAPSRPSKGTPQQEDANRNGDDATRCTDTDDAPSQSQHPVYKGGSATPRASLNRRAGDRTSAASTPSRRRTPTPKYAIQGDVVQPLTDRRSSETAIVVTPVMMLGGNRRSDSAVSDDGREGDQRMNGSSLRSNAQPSASIPSHRSPTRHLLNEASFNVPPRSTSNSLVAGASMLGATLSAEDRRNVSVSPLSRSPSASRSLEVDPHAVPLSNNVGCDVPLRELHKGSRPSAEGGKGKHAHVKHVTERHNNPNRSLANRDVSPTASKDEGAKPLWVNPGAKGRLSTVYERGRDNCSSREAQEEKLADSLVRSVYRAPSPSTADKPSQVRPATPARRPASAPRRPSPSTRLPVHDHSKRLPIAPDSINASMTSQERATTPSRRQGLAAQSVQAANKQSTKQRASSADRAAAGAATTSTQASEQQVEKPRQKQAPDYRHMLYHEIGPQGSVLSDMDVIVVDLRKEFKPNITHPPAFGTVLGVKKPTPHRSGGSPVPSADGSTSKASRNQTPTAAHQSALDAHERHTSCISPHRKVIPVEHVPTMPAFEMYSSFRDKQKGRESAWAKAPIKVGLFDVSPPRKRRIVADGGRGGTDARTASPNNSNARSHEANVRYDSYGHRLKIIRDAPHDPEAIEAQHKLVHRLSIPKPVYVRSEEMEHHTMPAAQ